MAQKRKRLPIRWARKLLKKQGGTCAVDGCGVVLIIGPKGQHVNWIDEHRIPVALCRTSRQANALKNRELRCIEHAREKTYRPKSGGVGGDLFAINKVKSIRKRRKAKPVWIQRKVKMRGRGFPPKGSRPMRRGPSGFSPR